MKNNILIYLTLPVDRSLPVESTPLIDFEKIRMKMLIKHHERVTYTERNFTDLVTISDYNNIDEDQHSSCSHNESDTGTNEREADEVLPKKKKRENSSKWSVKKPKSKLK